MEGWSIRNNKNEIDKYINDYFGDSEIELDEEDMRVFSILLSRCGIIGKEYETVLWFYGWNFKKWELDF